MRPTVRLFFFIITVAALGSGVAAAQTQEGVFLNGFATNWSLPVGQDVAGVVYQTSETAARTAIGANVTDINNTHLLRVPKPTGFFGIVDGGYVTGGGLGAMISYRSFRATGSTGETVASVSNANNNVLFGGCNFWDSFIPPPVNQFGAGGRGAVTCSTDAGLELHHLEVPFIYNFIAANDAVAGLHVGWMHLKVASAQNIGWNGEAYDPDHLKPQTGGLYDAIGFSSNSLTQASADGLVVGGHFMGIIHNRLTLGVSGSLGAMFSENVQEQGDWSKRERIVVGTIATPNTVPVHGTLVSSPEQHSPLPVRTVSPDSKIMVLDGQATVRWTLWECLEVGAAFSFTRYFDLPLAATWSLAPNAPLSAAVWKPSFRNVDVPTVGFSLGYHFKHFGFPKKKGA